jgi:hypothetical protein
MGRGGNGFLDQWHRWEIQLGDGPVLSRTAVEDVTPALVACFRLDGPPVHLSVAVELLAASGHHDAGLRMPSDAFVRDRFNGDVRR